MSEPVQLNLEEALARKAQGLDRVEGTHPLFVPAMREIAKALSRRRGEVHVDDLRIEAVKRGWRPRSGHAWGAIFRGAGWVKVGARRSAYPSNHGHVSPTWRWTGP